MSVASLSSLPCDMRPQHLSGSLQNNLFIPRSKNQCAVCINFQGGICPDLGIEQRITTFPGTLNCLRILNFDGTIDLYNPCDPSKYRVVHDVTTLLNPWGTDWRFAFTSTEPDKSMGLVGDAGQYQQQSID